jgi:succinate dehydrogenase/fumarate reductase flavoprotein subunit
VFDADAVTRENWDPQPPHVDPDGWFFAADTLADLARAIRNAYQVQPMPPSALEETVARYNGFVDAARDADFAKPSPAFKIQAPPFYAAWSTPILHDSLTGLRIDTRCRVLDLKGAVLPGLYAAGETAGGFGLHGLPRVLVFGRIAGKAAAMVST